MQQMKMESKALGRSNSRTEKQSIWREILDDAKRTCEFLNSHLVVLGRKDVGKSNMVKCLQRIAASAAANMSLEEYKDSDGVSALDYAFLNVKNVDDDDPNEALAKCNLWIMQSKDHKPLLMSHLRKPDVIKTLGFLICLDLSKPWELKSDLKYWLDLVVAISTELHQQVDVDELTEMKKKLAHYIAHYKDTVLKETAEDFAKRTIQAQQSTATDRPETAVVDAESTLKLNVAFPIVICVCKSDAAAQLDTRTTQGHIDVVQAHLRDIMLPYGAALCYCYRKDVDNFQNFDLLYRYIMHRLYNFEFKVPYLNESPETLFVPSGWDTKEAIVDFAKTTVATGLEKSFESIITKPTTNVTGAPIEDSEVLDVDGLNTFLSKALAQYPQVAANAPREPRVPSTREQKSSSTRDSESSQSKLQKEAKESSTPGKQASIESVKEESANVSGTESPPVTNEKKAGSGAQLEKPPKDLKRSTTPRTGGHTSGRKTHTARGEGAHTSRQAPVSARQQNGDKSLRNFFETLLNKGQSGSHKAPGEKSKPSG